MRTYFYIAFGGALGALFRFIIKNIELWQSVAVFPIETLVINVTGSFLALLFLTSVSEAVHMDPDRRLFVATGFLGSYTTFSALCKESVELLQGTDYFMAFLYLATSVFLGLLGAYAGHSFARRTVVKWIWTHHSDPEQNQASGGEGE